MHIERRFHFDNSRVLMSHLQHDRITVCNRSVALLRPARPECNNCRFSGWSLLSEPPAQLATTSDRGAEKIPRYTYARAPQGFWGARGFVCVRRCPTFPPGWVVSSALAGLASGFGMGPGVSLSLWPP